MRPCAFLRYVIATTLWPALLYGPVRAEVRDELRSRAFVDFSYGLNFNFPENHQFRNKQTTPQTNEPALNMAYGSWRKEPTASSRWGFQAGLQAGNDTDKLVPEGNDKPIAGADVLRHLAQANVTYLAPVGKGLALTAGLMKGFINYESFYSVNNFNYTRAYVTDYSPNFIFGIGSRYPITENLDVGFHVLNGFQHLAHPNNLPSYGAELDWRMSRRVVLAQNLYYGPDQDQTDLRWWRFFSDTQLEWRGDHVTVAAVYDIGTERAADQPSAPRLFWTGAALFTKWELRGPWSLALRPEVFWDRNGRMTQSEQLLWAVTSTLEYRRHHGAHMWAARLEHRFDRSTGVGGGFFWRDQILDTQSLARDQHLVLVSLLWVFDS